MFEEWSNHPLDYLVETAAFYVEVRLYEMLELSLSFVIIMCIVLEVKQELTNNVLLWHF